jgi:hypothetical protein
MASKNETSKVLASDREEMNMKKKIIVLLAVVLAAGTPLAPRANAIDFSISIGDRPFFFGPSYWHQGYQWAWVPGYRYHGRWVRGHYERRGKWHRAHARASYRHHRHYDDRSDDRGRDRHRDRDRDRDHH